MIVIYLNQAAYLDDRDIYDISLTRPKTKTKKHFTVKSKSSITFFNSYQITYIPRSYFVYAFIVSCILQLTNTAF